MKVSLGLIFPGTLQDESVICYLCKNFNVTLNIIEASFSMSSGWAFITIDAKKEDVEKVMDYIASKNIKIQKIGSK